MALTIQTAEQVRASARPVVLRAVSTGRRPTGAARNEVRTRVGRSRRAKRGACLFTQLEGPSGGINKRRMSSGQGARSARGTALLPNDLRFSAGLN